LSIDVSPVNLCVGQDSAGRGINKQPPMKKLVSVVTRAKPIAASAAFVIAATLAAAFWFASSPAGMAQATCTVCHKRTTTLTFPCASLDYRRHIDHGDAMNACGVTPTQNP
jgi:hypothetical protein